MIREMTLGQYYKSDSILHKLDPRVKMMGTFIYIISLFLSKEPMRLVIAGTVLFVLVLLSKVPFKMYIRGVKPLIPIMIFTAIINAFFVEGEIIFSWWILHISREGLFFAGYMLIRLILLVIGGSIMTFTTTPNQLMDGIEKAFFPLNKINVPVHELAMMMSIALRFIPIMTEELDKIMKAQMSRGADFEEGNIIVRAKKLIPILVPLLISAIRRASDLALAMDARCYHGGEGRTRLYPLSYKGRDYVAYGIEFFYIIGMIAILFI